jgi:hypothetical protein
MWGRRTRKKAGRTYIMGKLLGECKTFMGRDVKGGEKYMYLVCDFNGRWLKDSNFLCCIVILLKVEGRVVGIIQVGCFL